MLGGWNSAWTSDVEEAVVEIQNEFCDVGACAALAGTGGWKWQPLPVPLSHPPVKLGFEVQILIDGLQKG